MKMNEERKNVNFMDHSFIQKMYSENNPVLWISGKMDENDALVMETFVGTSMFTKDYLVLGLAAAVRLCAERKDTNPLDILEEIREHLEEVVMEEE